MRHSKLASWYTVAWDKAISAGTTIEGIRKQGKKMFTGMMLPGNWLDDVPPGRLFMLMDKSQLGLFDEYEPTPSEELILYTAYPARKPGKRFKSQDEGKTRWYRVTGDAPFGVAALRSVDGVCTAGDVAHEGDIIPRSWMSALSLSEIDHLKRDGLRPAGYHESLNPERRVMFTRMPQFPLIVEVRPGHHELDDLYEKYPGLNPDNTVNIEKDES